MRGKGEQLKYFILVGTWLFEKEEKNNSIPSCIYYVTIMFLFTRVFHLAALRIPFLECSSLEKLLCAYLRYIAHVAATISTLTLIYLQRQIHGKTTGQYHFEPRAVPRAALEDVQFSWIREVPQPHEDFTAEQEQEEERDEGASTGVKRVGKNVLLIGS